MVPQPLHPLLEVFRICHMFDFKFLPWPGTLFDQDDDILDAVWYIKNEIETAKEEARKRQEGRPTGKGGRPRVAGRPH